MHKFFSLSLSLYLYPPLASMTEARSDSVGRNVESIAQEAGPGSWFCLYGSDNEMSQTDT